MLFPKGSKTTFGRNEIIESNPSKIYIAQNVDSVKTCQAMLYRVFFCFVKDMYNQLKSFKT